LRLYQQQLDSYMTPATVTIQSAPSAEPTDGCTHDSPPGTYPASETRKEEAPVAPSSTAAAAAASDSAAAADEIDTTQGYKGFGSFHSDNVEDLIAIPDGTYQAPDTLPDYGRCFLNDPVTEKAQRLGRHFTWEEAQQFLGRPLRASHYALDPSWTFVNHGAFGGALKHGMAAKRHYEDLMESQPLAFIDRLLLPLLVYSTRSLARFLNARPKDIVLVSNATFGLNAAINATLRHPTDLVCYLDTEYGSVWKMMRERCAQVGCDGFEIPLAKHFLNEEIIKSDDAVTAYIESQLPANCTTFVVDHLASTSAIGLPVFTHIIPMLRRNGVKNIVVDGAHGPLQHALDFKSLTPEQHPTVYVGNLHKWVSSPKSVGFIWAAPEIQKRMHSPVVSHGSRVGYLSEFIWDGTKDYGAYLSLPPVLDFWSNTIGVDNARRYCTELMESAEALLCAGWGTRPVPRGAPFMKLVRLPEFFQGGRFSAKFIQDALHVQYKVELPVKSVDGGLYVRVSAFVNNCLEDYQVLRDAILDLATVFRKRARSDDSFAAAAAHGVQRTPPQPPGTRVDCGGCGVPIGGVKTHGFSDSSDSDAE
jgi:selenocysteine lyase/cysteine desulfurase